MKLCRICLLTCHLVGFYAPELISQSEEILFESIPIESGISDLRVTAIVQDTQGYMWFGTHDGLNRYDGYQFTVYRHDPLDSNSLPGNYVEELFVDSRGNLWVGNLFSDIGISRYDPQLDGFIRYRPDSASINSTQLDCVQSIAETRDGHIWFGCRNAIDRYDPKSNSFKHFQHDPDDESTITGEAVFLIYEDLQGNLWVGTGIPWSPDHPGGLNQYHPDTETFTRFTYDPYSSTALRNHAVMAALEDSRGDFWVGTGGDGIHRMNRGTGEFEHFPYDPSMPHHLSFNPGTYTSVYWIHEDYLGRLWFGGYGGLVQYDPSQKSTIRFTHTNGYIPLNPWEAYADRQANIWLGNGSAIGLFKFNLNPSRFSEYLSIGGNQSDAEVEYVNGLVWEEDDHFWLGSGMGVRLFNASNGQIEHSIPVSANVYDIEKQGSEILWIGSGNGLHHYNRKSKELNAIPFRGDSISPNVLNLHLSSSNLLWITTQSHGIYTLDPAKGVPVLCAGEYINWAQALVEDQQGQLWVGGSNGLFRFSKGADRWLHELEVHVNAIYCSPSGDLWIGTTGSGLWQYHPETGTLEKFTTEDGLAANSIFTMTEDQHGNLWMATSRKIILFNRKQRSFQNFDAGNGILNNFTSFSNGAVAEDLDGNVYFGGVKGITKISGQVIDHLKAAPQIQFTEIGTSKQSYPLLHQPISNIELPYDENNLTFEYVGLHYTNPSQNQYRFILENFDDQWTLAGTSRQARYTNLRPGKYIFKVMAASSEGIWSKERSLTVRIRPPWWRSWWAYLSYLAIFIGGIYSVDQFQRRRLIARERKKTIARELAQAKEIEQAYAKLQTTQSQLIQAEKMASLGELTAGIAHEIQNPLNFVNNFSEINIELANELINATNEGDTANIDELAADLVSNQKKILHHGQRADQIVKNMIAHAKPSSGEKALIDINALVDEYLRLSHTSVKANNNDLQVEIKMDLNHELPKFLAVTNDLGRVLQNLYSNAFDAIIEKKSTVITDYTPQVKVHTQLKTDGTNRKYIEIVVSDNGPGITEEVRKKMFQPFFTTKSGSHGTGLGLSLSYDIIKAMDGEIKVKSTPGRGTEMSLYLPVA